MKTLLPIDDIRTDGGTQPRAEMHQPTIEEYLDDYREGAEFPPLTVYFDGSEYWLADGFHRLAAAIQAELQELECDVTQGDRRAATLYSLGANARHGLRRSNADKRRAVLKMLLDDEWQAWSNREIARRTSTSHTFVAKMRNQYAAGEIDEEGRPIDDGFEDAERPEVEVEAPIISAHETLEAGVLDAEQAAGLYDDEDMGGPPPVDFDVSERPSAEERPSESPFYEDMPPGEQYAPVQAFSSSPEPGEGEGGEGPARPAPPSDAEMEQVLDLLGAIEKLSEGARELLFEELRLRFHDFFSAAA